MHKTAKCECSDQAIFDGTHSEGQPVWICRCCGHTMKRRVNSKAAAKAAERTARAKALAKQLGIDI